MRRPDTQHIVFLHLKICLWHRTGEIPGVPESVCHKKKATSDFISQPKEQKPEVPDVSLSHPDNGIKSEKPTGLCLVSLWFPGCTCPLGGSCVFPPRHPVLNTNLQGSCIQSICSSFVRLQLYCFLLVFFSLLFARQIVTPCKKWMCVPAFKSMHSLAALWDHSLSTPVSGDSSFLNTLALLDEKYFPNKFNV